MFVIVLKTNPDKFVELGNPQKLIPQKTAGLIRLTLSPRNLCLIIFRPHILKMGIIFRPHILKMGDYFPTPHFKNGGG